MVTGSRFAASGERVLGYSSLCPHSGQIGNCFGINALHLEHGTEFDLSLSVGDLRDDSGDHCPGRLAWAIGVKWS